jgi:NitT/TauT family transport system permease protein
VARVTLGPRIRRALLAIGAFVLLCAAWEGYKAIGGADSHVGGVELPASTDDISMPHVWDMFQRFGQKENRAVDAHSVGRAVLSAAWYTLQMAGAGFLVGVVVGLLLAVLMQRFRVVERGLLPYVVLSQTVPLVALAPVVSAWSARLSIFGVDWTPWMSVSAIAAYLAFFPVSVGALRGLQSPAPATIELLDSYAASWHQTLFKVRFPASVPHLVPALRLAAASSIVGAIVAEISTGKRGGIGRLILEYSREGTSDPAKVYTAIIAAAVLGLVVAGIIGVFELSVMRNRPKEVVA